MLPCTRCDSPVRPGHACPHCGGAARRIAGGAAAALLGLIVGSPMMGSSDPVTPEAAAALTGTGIP